MGCQNDAGILRGDKLSPEAKNKLVSNIKDEITNGTNGTGSRLFFLVGRTLNQFKVPTRSILLMRKNLMGFTRTFSDCSKKLLMS